MSSLSKHIPISVFQNTSLVILNKSDIVYINSKAKRLLCYKNETKNELHSLLYSAIKKKLNIVEIKCGNKIKTLRLFIENSSIEKEIQYFLILEDVTDYTHELEELKIQNDLFQEIFENLPVGVFLHDYGKLKYVNKEGKKIIGTSDKKKYLNYNLLNFLYIDKEKKRAVERIRKTYTEKKLSPTVYHIKNFKGKEKIIILSSVLFYTKDKPLALLIVQDKTEDINKQQLEIEAQLKHQENKLLQKQNKIKQKLLEELEIKKDQLLNTINYSEYLFWITDKHFKIILFNKPFYEYILKYYGIEIKMNMDSRVLVLKSNHITPSAKEERNKSIVKVFKEKKNFHYEVNQYDKELNKQRIYKISFHPTFEKDGEIKYIYCYGHEVTEKYEFLNQIEKQSVKINAIIENSPIYLWSMNKNHEITLFNNNYKKIVEKIYGETPVIGKKLSRTGYQQDIIETLEYHYQKAFHGSSENFKLEFKLDTNQLIALDINLFPIIINNEVVEIAAIATNITNELQKQQQLQSLVHENEILMKEIHHRIKNNLQVISSMINLQTQKEDNTQVRNVLKDTQNRVLSIAMIHQMLYQNKNYSSINITNTILLLVQNILHSFNRTDIKIQYELEDIILDVNTAIPISLIINEIITNVLKYAFPENYEGNKEVLIQLKRIQTDILLSIKDTGVGIPKQNLNQIIHTDFIIIRALVEQINAKMQVNSDTNQGTEIQLFITQI